MDKSIENVAGIVDQIKSELLDDVIKDYDTPSLVDMQTREVIGYGVVIYVSSKYSYSESTLNEWKSRLQADEYSIRVTNHRLTIKYKVRF